MIVIDHYMGCQESRATMRNSFHSCGLNLYICIDRTLTFWTIFCISVLERPLSSNSLSDTAFFSNVSSSSMPRILLSTRLKKSYSFLDLPLQLWYSLFRSKNLLWVATLSTKGSVSSSEVLFGPSSPNIGGKKERHIPLSSSSKHLRIKSAGIDTKITVSLSSTWS